MSKLSKLSVIAIMSAGLAISACSKQTFDIGGGGSRVAQDAPSTFFVNGIGQQQRIDAAGICGGKEKVASVEVEQTFINGLLGAATAGIYTPRQYRVVCTR